MSKDKYRNRNYQDYRHVRRKKQGKLLFIIFCILVIGLFAYLLPVWSQLSWGSKQSYDFENNLCKDSNKPVGTSSLTRKWLITDSNYANEESKETTYTFDTSGISGARGVYFVSENYKGGEFQELRQTIPFGTEYSIDFTGKDFELGQSKLKSYIYTDDKCYLVSENEVLNVSKPLYVAMTIDWEGYDISQKNLEKLESFSKKHNFTYTHFFNPRIYLPKAVKPERAKQITSWVKNREQNNGDVIGLHLHMFYDMVSEIGIKPKMNPRWDFRTTGSDVPSSEYSYEQYRRMLQWSKQKFAENGLSTPTSFRAGGWFLEEPNLKALADEGFRYDSSARVKYPLGAAKLMTPWDIQVTTAPYQISVTNQNANTPQPLLDLWEFPNNGLESNRLSAKELIANFDANFTGKPINNSRLVTYLVHPHDLEEHIYKMEEAYEHIELKKAVNDAGPVVFINLDQAYEEFAN